MILYQTPEHKHKWVDEGHIDAGKYSGTLFVCDCGRKEIDSGLTDRVMASLFQAVADNLPPLYLSEFDDAIKKAYMFGTSMVKPSAENGKITWEFF